MNIAATKKIGWPTNMISVNMATFILPRQVCRRLDLFRIEARPKQAIVTPPKSLLPEDLTHRTEVAGLSSIGTTSIHGGRIKRNFTCPTLCPDMVIRNFNHSCLPGSFLDSLLVYVEDCYEHSSPTLWIERSLKHRPVPPHTFPLRQNSTRITCNCSGASQPQGYEHNSHLLMARFQTTSEAGFLSPIPNC